MMFIVTDFLSNLGLLLDRHILAGLKRDLMTVFLGNLVTCPYRLLHRNIMTVFSRNLVASCDRLLHGDLMTVFLRHLLALFDRLFNRNFFTRLLGDLLTKSHGLLDWNVLTGLLWLFFTFLVRSVLSRADLFVGGGAFLLIFCLIAGITT